MPMASVNGIEMHYRVEGDGAETIVLINGLADDLETWVLQMDDLLGRRLPGAAVRQPRRRRETNAAGPYTSRMLADDAKALVDQLGITGFPPDGDVRWAG